MTTAPPSPPSSRPPPAPSGPPPASSGLPGTPSNQSPALAAASLTSPALSAGGLFSPAPTGACLSAPAPGGLCSSPPSFLRSALLSAAGAAHGFATRAVGDDAARLAALLGLPGTAIHTVRQVHGDRVVECPAPPGTEADALVAREPGVAVGVRTADCVPLLLFDPASGLAAAAHAGWRGTLARVAARAVEALVARGARPADLLVAIGPHIGACCYEVGEDLAERFLAAFGPQALRRDAARPRLDLAHCNRVALLAAGIDAARIERVDGCTHHQPERWFSHRREKERAGRQLSFVAAGAG